MKDWNEVLQHISNFRKKGLIITNFYPNKNEMEEWIKDNSFYFFETEKSAFFVHSERNIKYIFFFLNNLNDINQSLIEIQKQFPSDQIAYDFILSDNEQIEFLKTENKKYNFFIRTELKRMSFVKKDIIVKSQNDVNFADKKDIDGIKELFEETFDPISERIPSEKQLLNYIINNQILVIKNDNVIAGCAVIEIQKKTMYLKHLVTNISFRNQGVATRLLNQSFFLAKDCMRFILWVKVDNESAINLYKKFGYKDEILKNFTFYKGV